MSSLTGCRRRCVRWSTNDSMRRAFSPPVKWPPIGCGGGSGASRSADDAGTPHAACGLERSAPPIACTTRCATVYLGDFLSSAGVPDLVYAKDAEKGKDYICLSCGEAVRIFDWRGGRYCRHAVKQDCDFPHRVVTLSTEV